MQRQIQDLIHWDDTGEPLSSAMVVVYDISRVEPLPDGKTNKRGMYEMKWRDPYERECVPEIYVVVNDNEDRQLASTLETPLRLETEAATLNLSVSARLRPERHERRTLQAGPLLLDAEAVAEAELEIVLDIARAMVEPDSEERANQHIAAEKRKSARKSGRTDKPPQGKCIKLSRVLTMSFR